MATKSQHTPAYERLRKLLRKLREEAELTQRDLGARLMKPQSWVYNCETDNRRMDVTEFIAWAEACGVQPQVAFDRLLQASKEKNESSPDPTEGEGAQA